MPSRSYKGAKRRRELDKKKKKEEKAKRKADRGDEPNDATAYLEYLYPGGIPDHVLAEHGLLDDDGSEDDEEEADSE